MIQFLLVLSDRHSPSWINIRGIRTSRVEYQRYIYPSALSTNIPLDMRVEYQRYKSPPFPADVFTTACYWWQDMASTLAISRPGQRIRALENPAPKAWAVEGYLKTLSNWMAIMVHHFAEKRPGNHDKWSYLSHFNQIPWMVKWWIDGWSMVD